MPLSLAKRGQMLHKFRLAFEHWQVTALINQLQLGPRDVLAIGLAMGRRHQPVMSAPEEQGGALDSRQASRQFGIIGTLPDHACEDGHRLIGSLHLLGVSLIPYN